MPYAYKTSQPTKDALRRGDLALAVNPTENLGPTSETGYYNTIKPPAGGYAIYSLGLNNRPIAMIVTTDDEVIRAANTLGGSVSTKSDALNYLAGRTSTWILHNTPRNRITEGLRLVLNAGVVSSYPTTGNTFYDLSGYNNNWTPLTDVTFNGQSFEFNGTTSYMQDTVSSFNPDSAPNVMEVLFKPMDLGSRQQAIFSDNWGPEYGIWIYSDNTLRGAAYTSVQTSNIEVGRWYYAVLNVQPGENKSSTDQTYLQFYVNGQFIGENNANTGNGMNDQPFSLGFDYKSNNPNDFFSGSIALARLSYGEYSQENVNQNYYGSNIVTDGLVGAFDPGNLVSYESGSTTTYSMTGSLEGALNNGVGFNSNYGGIWDFDGSDDHIDLGDQSSLDFTNGVFSIECWVYFPSSWTGGSKYPNLVSKGATAGWDSDGWALFGFRDWPSAGNKSWGFGIRNGSTVRTVYIANRATDEYLHIVATLDGSTMKLYENGVQVNTKSQTTNPASNNTKVYIGRDANSQYFPGKIANVKAYNKTLSDSEVLQNYNAQKTRFGL